MNDHYIYISKKTNSGDSIKFNFPYRDMSRVPNMSIQLIQGSLGIDNIHEPEGIICKMELPVSNYSSDGNTGTILGMFNYTTHVGPDFGYNHSPVISPSYNINSIQSFFEISLYEMSGAIIDPTVVTSVNLLFKLSFPKPDELEMDYRSRVPLPSRLI